MLEAFGAAYTEKAAAEEEATRADEAAKLLTFDETGKLEAIEEATKLEAFGAAYTEKAAAEEATALEAFGAAYTEKAAAEEATTLEVFGAAYTEKAAAEEEATRADEAAKLLAIDEAG